MFNVHSTPACTGDTVLTARSLDLQLQLRHLQTAHHLQCHDGVPGPQWKRGLRTLLKQPTSSRFILHLCHACIHNAINPGHYLKEGLILEGRPSQDLKAGDDLKTFMGVQSAEERTLHDDTSSSVDTALCGD